MAAKALAESGGTLLGIGYSKVPKRFQKRRELPRTPNRRGEALA
jgi:hypothetical protein